MTKIGARIKVFGLILSLCAGAVFLAFTNDWPVFSTHRARGSVLMLHVSSLNRLGMLIKWEVKSSSRGALGYSLAPDGDWHYQTLSRKYYIQPGERLNVTILAGVQFVEPVNVITCNVQTDKAKVAEDRHVKESDTPMPDVSCIGSAVNG